jgi:hypothetical protein
MPSTARVKQLDEEQGSGKRWQELRLVEAQTYESRSAGDVAEIVGLGLIVLASWFIAALIFAPQLSGLF